jgi:hypothetical protein
MYGAFKVGAVVEVVAASTGNPMQALQLMPALVKKASKGEGQGNHKTPSNNEAEQFQDISLGE